MEVNGPKSPEVFIVNEHRHKTDHAPPRRQQPPGPHVVGV